MQRRTADLILSALGWLGFNAVMLWTVVFLAAVVVPRSVDGPVRIATGPAITVDLALLLLFAAQHSLMARRSVKARLRRRVPQRLERTTFVLATDVCLVLLLVLWQPWGGEVRRVDGVAAVLLWSLFAAGWLLAVVSTSAIDQLELTGLRQAGWAPSRDPGPDTLKVDGLYGLVRHPLMTGLLVAFWATPRMSAPHLLLAAATTGYILLGVHFEERDLRRTFGAAYDEYAARVPALVPGLIVRRAVLR
ncbi:methyltransferase family protein [Nocardioides sp. URHA0020]|uniref:methyltransferase family protein n=1 Tax=Nocardioides sp. URHA0020 TaxID=1380392 RepID=UPI00048D63C6|nr:isoprenylcysteine carboxylmethyltransferase family protein [Nocardioides sp. URHA0020]